MRASENIHAGLIYSWRARAEKGKVFLPLVAMGFPTVTTLEPCSIRESAGWFARKLEKRLRLEWACEQMAIYRLELHVERPLRPR